MKYSSRQQILVIFETSQTCYQLMFLNNYPITHSNKFLLPLSPLGLPIRHLCLAITCLCVAFMVKTEVLVDMTSDFEFSAET
jgi:hypothetical protein